MISCELGVGLFPDYIFGSFHKKHDYNCYFKVIFWLFVVFVLVEGPVPEVKAICSFQVFDKIIQFVGFFLRILAWVCLPIEMVLVV